MSCSSGTSEPDTLESLGGGIYAIDTGFQRPRFDAAYLLVDDGHAAFIDTGTGLALPRLLSALQALGLGPEQVDWVIPTHVHLDHAGGVGPLMDHLPDARVLVHPRGARHLIDPSALYQGALAVYGQEEMDRSYGELRRVPAERVVSSTDEMQIALGRRTLRVIDTPGHARHHHCVWDPVTEGWFTGDCFGLAYPEFALASGETWVFPTSTPVQFEPQAMRDTMARLMAAEPRCMYLTHFGKHTTVESMARRLLALLDQIETMGLSLRLAEERHDALKAALREIYLADLTQASTPLSRSAILDLLEMDVELNAQGMACWLDRAIPSEAGSSQRA
jgi:glyoxylase-like metal-dependent hydrolase (beta-lactamase superfamily II)